MAPNKKIRQHVLIGRLRRPKGYSKVLKEERKRRREEERSETPSPPRGMRTSSRRVTKKVDYAEILKEDDLSEEDEEEEEEEEMSDASYKEEEEQEEGSRSVSPDTSFNNPRMDEDVASSKVKVAKYPKMENGSPEKDDEPSSEIRAKAMAMQKVRMEQIRKRDLLLAGLNLDQIKNGMGAPPKPEKKPWTKRVYVACRKSSRSVEGPVRFEATMEDDPAPERLMGTITAEDAHFQQEDISIGEILEKLQGAATETKNRPPKSWNTSKGGVLAETKSLSARSGRVRLMKMPDKTSAIAWHHGAVDPLLLAGGSVKGQVGICSFKLSDLDDNEVVDGWKFQPHTERVTCMSFGPEYNSNRLVSSSCDGSLRSFDFEKGEFTELYRISEERVGCNFFAFRSEFEIVLVQENGAMVLLDTRTDPADATIYDMGRKCHFRTVDVHPTDDAKLVTANVEANVCLWDLRALPRYKPLVPYVTLPEGKGQANAFFSPITGEKILTTNHHTGTRSHTLTVFNVAEKKLAANRNSAPAIFTGTSSKEFKATLGARWHPKSEELFITRGMRVPRVVEMFDIKGPRKAAVTLGEGLLTSNCAHNLIHPRMKAIAVMGESGYAYLWT